VRFPYVLFPARPDAAFPARQVVARPALAISLHRGGSDIIAYALVDSGADNCIFPASLAGQLGITIPNQNAYVFSGTQDAPQLAYFETVTASIWDIAANRPHTFELYAGFCATLEHIGLGLLGQDGFFSRFTVAFDHRNRCFDVTPAPQS